MGNTGIPAYLNSDLSIHQRVEDLLGRMTVHEKISQMLHKSPPIPRLGIPGYNWWNECLHGVGRAGYATVFPQAIGLAATWNPELIYRVATAISDEARAKYNQKGRVEVHDIYYGLTFWTPNVNIFRDPRWGRGQETYGEDPFLTSRMGVNFIKGLQGDHPKYLKTVATPKHFAVHSGPEAERHGFNAEVSMRDMRTTYLPAFEAAVVEGQAESIMGAYNRTNGEACCASTSLLQHILREEWGFEGHVVSDCGAISDVFKHHQIVESAAEAASLAVKNGCDLNCGETYQFLVEAFDQDLISEEIINRSVRRLLQARFKLGMFDSFEKVPYNFIPSSIVDCPVHRHLALETARESIVLLKNDNLLPLKREKIHSIAVIGPKADDELVLRGNYYGEPVEAYSIYQGLVERSGKDICVKTLPGCDLTSDSQKDFDEAINLAENSDIVVMVLGLSQLFEGEEGQEEGNLPGERSFGDRSSLDLPGVQEELLKAIHETGKPIILVLLNGSAVAINWANENVKAILEAWYPGQAGGLAVGDVIFGDYNPTGKLPVTFYQDVNDLPPFRDYSMAERTYRYFTGKTIYPFGYGLSYSTFKFSKLRLYASVIGLDEIQKVSVSVTNTGTVEGDEVVQLYVSDHEASVPVPNYSLMGFEKTHLVPGETKIVQFNISPSELVCYDEDGYGFIEPGRFNIFIGDHAPSNDCAIQLSDGLETFFEVVEELQEKKYALELGEGFCIEKLPYLFYKPKTNHTEKLPLILFLHGMGSRGDDLTSIRIQGLPMHIENGADYPCIIVSPQCPQTKTWIDLYRELNRLIDEILETYSVDRERIYITGLSMGGFGTWRMLLENPDRFAAAAPICGGMIEALYNPELLKAIINIPIWNFHGDADSVVPVENSDYLVKTLKEMGAKIRYTRYPGVDHDSWTETYANPALLQWMLSKTRKGDKLKTY